jgi:hypothetical protein
MCRSRLAFVHENPFVRFLLVRHGQHQTAGMASQDDTGLTAQGREQVARPVGRVGAAVRGGRPLPPELVSEI